jgi:hypothetical protein
MGTILTTDDFIVVPVFDGKLIKGYVAHPPRNGYAGEVRSTI